MPGIPTLVVDDDEQVRGLLRLVLEENGCEVDEAPDGRGALARLGSRPFELVVTDLKMPQSTGFEVLKAVKASFPETSVVVVSGQATLEDTCEAIRLGALDFVTKPFRRDEIRHVLDRFRRVKREAGLATEIGTALRTASRTLELPSDPDVALVVASALTRDLPPLGLCTPAERESVTLAIHEAILNAVIHGNLEVRSEVREHDAESFDRVLRERRTDATIGARKVRLAFQADRTQAEYVIEDEGAGFDVRDLGDPTDADALLRTTGRGILIIRLTMDAVSWNERGNSIRMVWRRKTRSDA